MTEARILLTGSSGYLGQHLLHQILTQQAAPFSSFHVCALYGNSREFPDAVRGYACGTSSIELAVESLDLTDAEAVKAFFRDRPPFDVCIHAAALSSPRMCEQDKQKAYSINIPKAFFQELHRQSCAIIALCTDQVYDGTRVALYTESDPAQPVNVYGTTKLQMETYLQELFGKQSVILRSSIILGKKAPIAAAHDTFVHFCASREGRPTEFYSDERRSVVFVDDVVATILFFTKHFVETRNEDNDGESKVGGVYNMGGPASVSRVDMAEAVFEHLAYDKTNSIVPKQKAELSAGPVPSPLDISMDSSKLETLMNREFAGMDVILQSTFPR